MHEGRERYQGGSTLYSDESTGCSGLQRRLWWQQHKAKIFSPRRGRVKKGFRSPISEISEDTFNTGKNEFAAQFMQLHKNIANYLQQMLLAEGYLVAKIVRTGKKQIIKLLPPINESAVDANDQKIIRAKEVKTIAKRRLKLGDALKIGYVMVYDQCLQEVKDNLKATDDWDRTQRE